MCSSTDSSSMADAQKTRRSNKPLMERRRRERINHCLNELKNLVLTAQKKDPTRYSKLEKADILEMTVRHVQALHRQDTSAPRHASSDSSAKYRAGFTQCASEVSRFLAGVSGLPSDLHARVLNHLSSSASPEPISVKAEAEVPVPAGSPQQQETPQGSLTGVPLVQARLASGHLALVLPSWTAISSGNSSPTNAASPEAAGAPSSPESARGSPQAAPDTPEERVSPDTCTSGDRLANTRLQPYLGPSSSAMATIGQQPAPQMAPLDLATPHRRTGTVAPTLARQQAFTVSVDMPRPSPALKPRAAILPRPASAAQRPLKCAAGGPPAAGQCQARHAPYPAHHHRHHHHHHQNPHWRPW